MNIVLEFRVNILISLINLRSFFQVFYLPIFPIYNFNLGLPIVFSNTENFQDEFNVITWSSVLPWRKKRKLAKMEGKRV